jgi:hypothetical protein
MGEYVPQAGKGAGGLSGMGGVYNTVNLHTYHYAGNNPVKYVDPDGRMDEDFRIWQQVSSGEGNGGSITHTNGILEKLGRFKDYIDNEWQNPAFIIGFSANATGPLMSSGSTSGMYFVPESRDDPMFYMAFANFIAASLSTKPGSNLLAWVNLKILKSVSADYGIFTDMMNAGTGWTNLKANNALSASIGGTFGVFKSLSDFAGTFNETGASIGIRGVSIGGDASFNINRQLIGITSTIGVTTKGSINPEFHSRVGHTFVYSEKNRARVH